MNNEETIIAQPKANEQTSTKQEKKRKSGKIVTAATSAAVGGVLGGVGTAAAMHHGNVGADGEISEPLSSEEQVTPTEESKVDESPIVTAQATEDEGNTDAPNSDNAEPDYTNHNHADPVITTEPQATAQVAVAVDEEQPEIQVLGVYDNVTDEGVHQTAAILTNGTEVAAVIDGDGDGIADVLAVDNNHNNQIDEGEVVDISDQNVHMTDCQQLYAQQQMEQQQMDDMAYNAANDDMPDYDNNADA